MKGSIRQRGETHTAYWFTLDPATGKRVQHSKGGFKTKGGAQKHLNVVVGKVEEGAWRPDTALTVKSLLEDHWLPAQKARGLRPSTIAQYENAVAHWVVPNLGGVKAKALRPIDERLDALAAASGPPLPGAHEARAGAIAFLAKKSLAKNMPKQE